MKQHLMILFAKAPVPGRVKTRLIPALTAEQAASLHERLVEHTWLALESLDADRELHTDTPTGAWPETQPRALQVDGDLGVRMFAALRSGLERGYRKAAIIGSDAPGLPAAHLRTLLDSDADVALGPAEDGGYYAIACRRIHPLMFANVRWSTEHACADTVVACRHQGLTVITGEPWFDIDTPSDLKRLQTFGFGGGRSFASQVD